MLKSDYQKQALIREKQRLLTINGNYQGCYSVFDRLGISQHDFDIDEVLAEEDELEQSQGKHSFNDNPCGDQVPWCDASEEPFSAPHKTEDELISKFSRGLLGLVKSPSRERDGKRNRRKSIEM